MTGHITGWELQTDRFTRLAVVLAMIAAMFVVIPPVQAVASSGFVDFEIATSTAPEGTTPHPVALVLDVGVGNTLDVDFSVDVTVVLAGPGTAVDPDDYTITTNTVTFLAGDPDGFTRPVDITIVNDLLDEVDETIELELTNPVGTSAIGSTQVTHQVTITDDDTAGVTVTPTTVSATEGGPTGSYDVVLTSQPTADVTVTVASSDGQTTPSPTPLTFTTSSWATPQTVTVTAFDDAAVEGAHVGTITHTATSTDSNYNGIRLGDSKHHRQRFGGCECCRVACGGD